MNVTREVILDLLLKRTYRAKPARPHARLWKNTSSRTLNWRSDFAS